MKKAAKFVFDANLMSAIGALIPGKKSILSPLQVMDLTPLTDEQKASLSAAELADDVGMPSKAFKPALEVLGGTPVSIQVGMRSPVKALGYSFYFAPDGKSLASLHSTTDGLVLSHPVDVEEVVGEFKLFTGESPAQSFTFEVTLPLVEAMVLAVFIDQRRKAVLKAIADDMPVGIGAYDENALGRLLASGVDSPQWLTAILKPLAGVSAPPPFPMVQAALAALVGKGFLAFRDRKYMLAEPVFGLADRMLLIQNQLTLYVAHTNEQDKVAVNSFVFLQLSLTDVLSLENQMGNIAFKVLSVAGMLDMLRRYLTDVDAVPALPVVHKKLMLSVLSGANAGMKFPLNENLEIGRDKTCGFMLNDPKASRHHVMIEVLESGYKLNELGSTNGTLLNGVLVKDPMWLKEGDIILIGESQIAVVAQPEGGLVDSPATVYAAAAEQPAAPAPAPAGGAFCVKCNAPLGEKDLFCANCGAPVARSAAAAPAGKTCPRCNSPVMEGARFCGSCGSPLG